MSKAAKFATKGAVKAVDDIMGDIIPVKEISKVMDDGVTPMEKAMRKIELRGAVRDDDGDGKLNFNDDDAVFSRATAGSSIWTSIWNWFSGDDTS